MSRGESPPIPLSRWATRQLADFAREAEAPALARLEGGALLGARASRNGFPIPHRQSAGGHCRLLEADNGWIALNLAREDDRAMLPALLEADPAGLASDAAIACEVARHDCHGLVARGREMGMAIAALAEADPPPPASETLCRGESLTRNSSQRPLVVDLSALWAGPLASHLLWLAGAQVIKVEASNRPDALRLGDPGHFAQLNQGKASAACDFRSRDGRAALLSLLDRADIVIEASRPRALLQLGIDAEALIARRPGLVWLTITAHGASGPAADWIGFGDDCGVAGGLSAAMAAVTGRIGLVGDAIADPLTGIAAARAGWRLWRAGSGIRLGMAMRGVVAEALAAELAHDPALFERELEAWAGAAGAPFPAAPAHPVTAQVQGFGADTAEWLGLNAPC